MLGHRFFLGFLLLAGCQSDPTEADALKWFAEHRSTIDAMEKRVLAAVQEYPRAGPTMTCDDLIAADPLKGRLEGGVVDLPAGTRCGNASLRWQKRAAEKAKAWRPKAGKNLLDGKRIAGIEVGIERSKPLVLGAEAGGRWLAGCGSAALPGRPGAAPEDGVTVDGFQLGWGLANLSVAGSGGTYENSEYYPALYVLRRVSLPHVNIEIRMSLLTTKEVPAEYLKLERGQCP